MLSILDMTKLRGLLRDFYALSHLRITVFDEARREIISYPPEMAPYCVRIRETAEGRRTCLECDREGCAVAAAGKQQTHVYRCHAGLTEAATPLYVGDVLIGYLLFGQVFSYPSREEGLRTIGELCRGYDIDHAALAAELSEAELFTEEYVRSAARLMHAVASYLVMERVTMPKANALAVRLDAYLSAHFTEKVSAAGVCRALEIGKTRLYQLCRELYGKGMAEHVRDLRLARAKELLAGREDLTQAEIAGRCGFADYNYFIAVFSAAEGVSPGQWRRTAGQAAALG